MCIANASRCAMGAVLVIGLIAFIYREVPPRTPHKVERFTTLWPQLESAFYKATDRVVSLPQPWFPIEPTPVSVVDSAVDTPPPRPGRARWEHGRAMGLIIHHLTCPDPSQMCLGGVESTLATRFIMTDQGPIPDEVQGGRFGTLEDLATGIVNAVHKAQSRGQRRIIINLSLGWEPHLGGYYTEQGWTALPAPIQAVRRAIGYATCQGAVVIAAAGNRSDTTSGAIFPAAWEAKPLPDVAECQSYGLPTGPPPSQSAYRPLVYAAAGLDRRDQTLANARLGGLPALMAPASHVMVTDNHSHTGVYTGSSVAAAVLSAAASLAWSYQPHLSGPDMMQLVYDASVDLGVRAELCFEGALCRHRRRVSLCSVVQAACARQGRRCDLACRVRPLYQAVSSLTIEPPHVKPKTEPLPSAPRFPQSFLGSLWSAHPVRPL